jgi:hypothetical protein
VELTQGYDFAFWDSNGWQDISVANVLINNALDGRRGCYFAFVPSNVDSGTLYLVNDAGDAGGPFQSMALPGTHQVSNSQCAVTGIGEFSVRTGGNYLYLSLSLTFSPDFWGDRLIYAAARSASQNSGWMVTGSVTVPDRLTPVLRGIDPMAARAGSPDLALTVVGANFTVPAPCALVCGFACPGTSVVTFDNTDIPTQYMGSTKLVATIPAALLATARNAQVSVKNNVLIECEGIKPNFSTWLTFGIFP